MNAIRSNLRCLLHSTSVTYNSTRHFKRYFAPTQKIITSRKRRLGPQPIPKRNSFIEWNQNAEIYAFNERLHEKFDLELLNRAFVFESYVKSEMEKQKATDENIIAPDTKHNTDLYTKGSALTSKVVYNYLSKSLPRVPDNGIRALHDYLLSEKVLAEVSQSIGTTHIILCDEHPVTEATLAHTFLALVGALTESTNDEHAAIFVRDFLLTTLADKDLLEIWCPDKPIELLNSMLSEQGKQNVNPRLISQTGKNTLLSSYQVGLYCNKQFLGSGFGQTVEEALQVASINTLSKMLGLSDSSQPLRFNKSISVS